MGDAKLKDNCVGELRRPVDAKGSGDSADHAIEDMDKAIIKSFLQKYNWDCSTLTCTKNKCQPIVYYVRVEKGKQVEHEHGAWVKPATMKDPRDSKIWITSWDQIAAVACSCHPKPDPPQDDPKTGGGGDTPKKKAGRMAPPPRKRAALARG